MAVVLDTYRNDPVGFVEEVLGDAPYAKQREMLEAVVHNRRVSVVGANGSGKDWTAARAVPRWIATRPRATVVVTGPTQRQVEEIVWRELRTAYKASRVPLGGRVSGSHWNIDDDRFAIGFSTNRPENLQGFHSPELLVVVTEAHAVPQGHMEALKRLIPARMLLTGNAFSRDGEFFDSHHTKGHLYTRVAISAFDTPNFTGENGGIPGTPTEEDVEERKLDWGEDHPLYQGSVLARFPDMLDDSLIGRTVIEQAVERWEQYYGTAGDGGGPVVPAEAGTSHPVGGGTVVPAKAGTSPPSAPRRLGVDVARFGSDKTALCVRRGWLVESLRSFERIDTMRTAGEALTLVSEQDIPAVFVDEGGLGAGVVDRLRELGAPVYGVQFGGKAPQSGRFVNMRAEIFWELRRLFNEGLVAIPRDEELISQLLGLRYDVTSAGQVKMESKSSLRRRGLRSPDKADALALAFMEPPSLQIWTGYEQDASVVPAEAGTSPPVVPVERGPWSGVWYTVVPAPPPSFLRRQEPRPCRTSGEGAMEWGVVYRRSCAPLRRSCGGRNLASRGRGHPSFQRRLESRRAALGGAVGGEGTQPPSFQRRLEPRIPWAGPRHSSGGWNPGAQRAVGRLGVRVPAGVGCGARGWPAQRNERGLSATLDSSLRWNDEASRVPPCAHQQPLLPTVRPHPALTRGRCAGRKSVAC